MPRVSIILPTHNRPALLAEALDSLFQQSLQDWEILIVDDASIPPVTMSAAMEHYGSRIRIIRHDTSQGGPAGKNAGAAAATGDYLAFLDDDDLLAPGYLEKAVTALESHAGVDVVFMGVEWFGQHARFGRQAYAEGMTKLLERADGRNIAPDLIRFGEGLFSALLRSVPMAFQRPVLRRDAFQRIGPYRRECFLWDCDWALRAARAGDTLLLQEALYRQRVDGQSLSSNPRRILDSMLSNAEIHEHLLAEEMAAHPDSRRIVLLRSAVAHSRFDLAYHYSNNRKPADALKAWLASQSMEFNLGRARLLGRILLNTLAPKRS